MDSLLKNSSHFNYKFSNNIELKLIDEGNDYNSPISQIILNNQQLNLFIKGKKLYIQIQVDLHRYILFLTDDIVFEETLTIYLIDCHEQMIMDEICIGIPYQTDFLTDVDILNNIIEFDFMAKSKWKLKYIRNGYYNFHLIYELFNPLLHSQIRIFKYLRLIN